MGKGRWCKAGDQGKDDMAVTLGRGALWKLPLLGSWRGGGAPEEGTAASSCGSMTRRSDSVCAYGGCSHGTLGAVRLQGHSAACS